MSYPTHVYLVLTNTTRGPLTCKHCGKRALLLQTSAAASKRAAARKRAAASKSRCCFAAAAAAGAVDAVAAAARAFTLAARMLVFDATTHSRAERATKKEGNFLSSWRLHSERRGTQDRPHCRLLLLFVAASCYSCLLAAAAAAAAAVLLLLLLLLLAAAGRYCCFPRLPQGLSEVLPLLHMYSFSKFDFNIYNIFVCDHAHVGRFSVRMTTRYLVSFILRTEILDKQKQ